MLTKGVAVEMVKTKNPIAMQAADKEDAILIAVTRNGQFWLSPGNNQIRIEDLAGKVRDLQTNKLDKTVYIRADGAPNTKPSRTWWTTCARRASTRSV